ncbi:MAG: hypothetical protein H0U59_00370 [Gemmatimonadaceae bacterium]|nr:hypothetical protein [Gemmatimonadaceae bacterium]MDQ3243760.1 hypothetical protein [Gemmatimonadota bacterium]
MTQRTLGKSLTTLGGIAAMAGVAALAVGFKMTIAPDTVDVPIYKGLLHSGFALIVAGTWVGRTAARARMRGRSSPGDRDALVLNAERPGDVAATRRVADESRDSGGF